MIESGNEVVCRYGTEKSSCILGYKQKLSIASTAHATNLHHPPTTITMGIFQRVINIITKAKFRSTPSTSHQQYLFYNRP
jgi:hypothetical protein